MGNENCKGHLQMLTGWGQLLQGQVQTTTEGPAPIAFAASGPPQGALSSGAGSSLARRGSAGLRADCVAQRQRPLRRGKWVPCVAMVWAGPGAVAQVAPEFVLAPPPGRCSSVDPLKDSVEIGLLCP